MMRLMMVRTRVLLAPMLVVALTACGTGAEDEVARSSPAPATEAVPTLSPSPSPAGLRTGRQTVEAFFAALRRGDADEAQKYVASGAISRAALDDLARLGEAVAAEVSGEGQTIQVLLHSDEPMQYWPQCPFGLQVTPDRQQIAAETSCALPPAPSPT